VSLNTPLDYVVDLHAIDRESPTKQVESINCVIMLYCVALVHLHSSVDEVLDMDSLENDRAVACRLFQFDPVEIVDVS
jgi:hypothetical protein